MAKRLVIFAPNFAKKSPFLHAQLAAHFFALSIKCKMAFNILQN
jgi:hypothetical protein